MNPVAIEGYLTLVLIQWMIIICAAYVYSRVGKRFFHPPLAVGEIAAGIILGLSVFGAVCFWLANHYDALELKLLTPALFTMLVIMALVTTAMCGPLLRWWLPKDMKALSPDD